MLSFIQLPLLINFYTYMELDYVIYKQWMDVASVGTYAGSGQYTMYDAYPILFEDSCFINIPVVSTYKQSITSLKYIAFSTVSRAIGSKNAANRTRIVVYDISSGSYVEAATSIALIALGI